MRGMVILSILVGTLGVPGIQAELSVKAIAAGGLQVRAWVPGPIAPGAAVLVTLVVGEAQSQPGVTLAVQ